MRLRLIVTTIGVITILLAAGYPAVVEAQTGAAIEITSTSPSEGSTLSGGQSETVTATVSWDTAGRTPEDIHVYINEDPYGEIDRQVDISDESGSRSITISEDIGSDWDQATLKVSLYEQDSIVALSTDTVTYVVDGSRTVNEAPNVDLQCVPDSPTVDEDVTCVSGGVDADGSIVDYYWDFDGESYFSAGDTQVHEFETSGRKTIQVEATDNDGATTTDSVTVSVTEENDAPTADIDCSASTVAVGESVDCNAFGSSDDNRITGYDWNFGDGSSGSGSSESHTYSSPGTYTIEATVTDADGLSDTDAATVTVEQVDVAPTADLECSPTTISAGESINCDVFGSSDDNRITGYDWNFGDGSSGSGTSESHTYSSPGTYTIEATVSDADGLSETDTTTITVKEVATAPTTRIECAPSEITVGESISCDASESTDDNRITEYSWDFDDGTTGFGASESHTYSSSGTYTIEGTVTDADGFAETETTTITVKEKEDTPPTANVECSSTLLTEGESIKCNAYRSTDDGRITDYRWKFDDNVEKSGERVSQTYDSPGSYTVELTVIDDRRLRDSEAVSVDVVEDTDNTNDDNSGSVTENLNTESDDDEVANRDSADDSVERDSTNTETPGFGVVSTIAGIGGLGYILKRRLITATE